MKILKFRVLNGPNIYHRKPVLVMTLDLQKLADVHSASLPGFNDRLVALLPGLKSHRCSRGYEGGFVERLQKGTYFAHIVEHIALELSGSAGVDVGYGKSVYGGSHGVYQVIVRFEVAEAMIHLLETAVELAEAVAEGKTYESLPQKLEEAREIAVDNDLGPSTRAIVNAAERMNVPWLRLNDQNLIQFGYGKNRRLIQATTTSQTHHIAVSIAGDKDLTKQMLEHASIRVPHGRVVRSVEKAIEAFHDLAVPVAIKPLDGNQGKGVSLNLTREDQVRKAFAIAQEYSDSVLVEELFVGADHRILVVNGKLVAAALRVPASVLGDGVHTISQLIEIENQNPLRGAGHEKPMTRIKVDNISENFLREQGIQLTDIPPPGARVLLRGTANLSTGGAAQDVTDEIHPEIRSICERAARIIGLDVCGIDFVIGDISAPPASQRGGIIEVNAGPGIRMHHFPSAGKARDAGRAIAESLFPAGGASSRIPIASITGTNGKTTVTRLLAHIVNCSGKTAGMTSSDGIYIGGELVSRGDTTGPISARSVLCDPAVEVAVLETARGGIVRRGLGYDWSDVGVLTNIQLDHIGQDGIEDIDDLVRIKSLVAEQVKEGGVLVLNADDENVAKLGESEALNQIEREKVYFALSDENELIRKHRSRGGRAVYLKNGWITQANASNEVQLIEAATIPLTFRGTAKFHIANAMAAYCAALALGVAPAVIVKALASFVPNGQNRGRTNLFKVRGGYAIIDYGHNPEAFRAITDMTAGWKAPRITGVVAVPGDRNDSVLAEAAKNIANGFDRVVIREDVDLRGRKAGHAANYIRNEILRVDPTFDCRVELDEGLVAQTVLKEMLPGEVIVFFYDNFDLIKGVLTSFGAELINELPANVVGVAENLTPPTTLEPMAS